MKARIEIKKEEIESERETVKSGFFGKKIIKTPVKEVRDFVYLFLELTEEEKAITYKNALDKHEIDQLEWDKIISTGPNVK